MLYIHLIKNFEPLNLNIIIVSIAFHEKYRMAKRCVILQNLCRMSCEVVGNMKVG